MAYRSLKLRKNLDNGRVLEYRGSIYFVPSQIKDMDLRHGDELEISGDVDESDGPEIAIWRGTQKDSLNRAQLWGRLLQDVGPSYEPEPIRLNDALPKATSAREETVPVAVALAGKAKIAAYLYCVGHSKLGISHALDVSERTVGQYLSDVRRGER